MQSNIKIINGKKKIIISAPHSVLHTREGNTRPSETKTGVLVKILSSKCKTYGIYKLKGEFNDANWDKECKYKAKVIEIVKKDNIKALIDLHGMADYRAQDICIGINGGKNIFGYDYILDEIINIFKKNGFKNVTIDNPFAAKHDYCVSTYIASQCKIPTFQIEINSKYRLTKYDEYKKYPNLVSSLMQLVNLINERIK